MRVENGGRVNRTMNEDYRYLLSLRYGVVQGVPLNMIIDIRPLDQDFSLSLDIDFAPFMLCEMYMYIKESVWFCIVRLPMSNRPCIVSTLQTFVLSVVGLKRVTSPNLAWNALPHSGQDEPDRVYRSHSALLRTICVSKGFHPSVHTLF
jgi:hypothetical protein